MPFLITGPPRSGTQYVANVLYRLGHRVDHEAMAEDGVVSWFHAHQHPDLFAPIVRQTREPLATIASITTIRDRLEIRNVRSIDGKRNYDDDDMMAAATFFVTISAFFDSLDVAYTYKVEDLPRVLPELLGVLDLEIVTEVPEVPEAAYDRKEHPTLTWDYLFERDKDLHREAARIARMTGYPVDQRLDLDTTLRNTTRSARS